MAGTLSRGYSFGATEEVTAAKLHTLVDSGSVSGIVADDIANSTITDAKITSVAGSKFITLSGIPAGAGSIPAANLGNSLLASNLDTDGTLAANSDTKIATQKAVKTYADTQDATKISIPSSGARGDILYHNGTNYVRLAKGTDGQYLKIGANDPAWAEGGLADASVTQAKLKTVNGEITLSVSSGGNNDYQTTEGNYTLPGGTYGFYPQTKVVKTAGAATGVRARVHSIDGGDTITPTTTTHTITPLARDAGTNPNESYITRIRACIKASGYNDSCTVVYYISQRYVTSSGEDHWLFLLVDKVTKDIISAYSSPDHPAYGNGGDFDALPHPFLSYDESKHEIVLVDNDTIAELKAKVTEKKTLLTLVNESYRPDMTKTETYKPLHSGKYLKEKGGEEVQIKELVKTIPDYIKVRKLIKK